MFKSTIFIFCAFFMLSPLLGMRCGRTLARTFHATPYRCPAHTHLSYTRPHARFYNESKREFSAEFEHMQHTMGDQDRARSQAWNKLEDIIKERKEALIAKEKKHRELVRKHTQYAQTYKQLADLETEKFELFALITQKLSAAAATFEEPDLYQELQILDEMCTSTIQLENQLPKEFEAGDKI